MIAVRAKHVPPPVQNGVAPMQRDDLDVIQDRRDRSDRRKGEDRRKAQRPFEGKNQRSDKDRRKSDRRTEG